MTGFLNYNNDVRHVLGQTWQCPRVTRTGLVDVRWKVIGVEYDEQANRSRVELEQVYEAA
jgi:hypothetical protein